MRSLSDRGSGEEVSHWAAMKPGSRVFSPLPAWSQLHVLCRFALPVFEGSMGAFQVDPIGRNLSSQANLPLSVPASVVNLASLPPCSGDSSSLECPSHCTYLDKLRVVLLPKISLGPQAFLLCFKMIH